MTASVEDALEICKSCPEVKEICLGGIRKAKGKKMIERQVYLSEEDLNAVKEIGKFRKKCFFTSSSN